MSSSVAMQLAECYLFILHPCWSKDCSPQAFRMTRNPRSGIMRVGFLSLRLSDIFLTEFVSATGPYLKARMDIRTRWRSREPRSNTWLWECRFGVYTTCMDIYGHVHRKGEQKREWDWKCTFDLAFKGAAWALHMILAAFLM